MKAAPCCDARDRRHRPPRRGGAGPNPAAGARSYRLSGSPAKPHPARSARRRAQHRPDPETAAFGEHTDWKEFDRAMEATGRWAKEVAAFRHAHIAAVKLAGDPNEPLIPENMTMDQLRADIVAEVARLGHILEHRGCAAGTAAAIHRSTCALCEIGANECRVASVDRCHCPQWLARGSPPISVTAKIVSAIFPTPLQYQSPKIVLGAQTRLRSQMRLLRCTEFC